MRYSSSLPVAPARRRGGVTRRRSFGRACPGALALIVLLAGFGPASALAQVEYIDPMGGFTQVVTTTDRGVKTIHVSGQVGQGETLQEHAESALEGVAQRLAQAGATPEDVVKIRVFVKDFTPDQYPIVAAARSAVFPEGHWPASTMVGVDELFIDTLRVEIEATAVVAEPGVDLEIERFAPSNGFSGAVAVTAHGVRTVYVAGQVGTGDGLAAQTASVWGRVGERLVEAGASFADVVKATTYIVDFDPDTDLVAYRDGRVEALSLTDMPASTLLGVPALAADRFLIEIDAVAVVGVDGQEIERNFIDPATGFSQAVAARGSGPATVRISGQVGNPGDSLESQADQVYAGLRQRLESAGGSPEDLLKVVIYLPEYSLGDFEAVDAARKAHGFPDAAVPAATLLGIQSLYARGVLLEVEGIAVVD
ncbi:MAG: RidA family protein [Acidobacteria bacterium]|nr:RidA family protein [Acidobacteriota bacterium]